MAMQSGDGGFIDISYTNGRTSGMVDFHAHEHLELFYCLSDGVACLIGDDIYTVNRHDVVLFDRGTLHRTIIPEGVRYERYVLSFMQSDLSRLTPEAAPLCRLFRAQRGHCVIHLADDPERDYFHGRMERMADRARGEGCAILQLSILLELLWFLNRRENGMASPAQDAQARQMQPVLRYLGEHYAEKLPLDALCRRFYMSRSRLTQTFRAVTGTTVGEYLTQLRMAHAMALLRGGMDVERVAARCGFGNVSHFIRRFGTYTGVSPKQYALRHGGDAGP